MAVLHLLNNKFQAADFSNFQQSLQQRPIAPTGVSSPRTQPEQLRQPASAPTAANLLQQQQQAISSSSDQYSSPTAAAAVATDPICKLSTIPPVFSAPATTCYSNAFSKLSSVVSNLGNYHALPSQNPCV